MAMMARRATKRLRLEARGNKRDGNRKTLDEKILCNPVVILFIPVCLTIPLSSQVKSCISTIDFLDLYCYYLFDRVDAAPT